MEVILLIQISLLPIFCLPFRQSASQEEGYDRATWTSDTTTHPPWLRFHLGITRWELYNRKDPTLVQLTHYLATQQILGAGEQIKGGGHDGWDRWGWVKGKKQRACAMAKWNGGGRGEKWRLNKNKSHLSYVWIRALRLHLTKLRYLVYN